MTNRCNKASCDVFENCKAIEAMMDIPTPVMQAMMQAMKCTSNYHTVSKRVDYDFELQGVCLREYYTPLLKLSGCCKLR